MSASRPTPAISRKYRSPARPTDTRRIAPVAITRAMRSRLPGNPSSRASTLDVPEGHTASGVGVPTRAWMASFTVPSPPWTITRSTPAASASAARRVASAGAAVVRGVTVIPCWRRASTIQVME